jgi:hypothetical protein
MNRILLWANIAFFMILVATAGFWSFASLVRSPSKSVAIPADQVADYVHAVIEAQRTIYTKNVVDSLQGQGVAEASEHWKDEKALPLPAQMILDGGRLVSTKGIGLKYRLASLTPIYVWNAPQSDFERKGLEAVQKDPDKPFTGFVQVGQDRVFQAVYADRAVSETCVSCHNLHPNSSRRDFKLNDVMGGVIITIPIKD